MQLSSPSSKDLSAPPPLAVGSTREESSAFERACQAAARGDIATARDLYARAIQAGAGAKAHNNLATLLEAAGERDRAIEAYRQALLLDPRCVEAVLNLGRLLAANGQLADAIQLYSESLAISDSRDVRRRMAEALAADGETELARSHFARLAVHREANLLDHMRLACTGEEVHASGDGIDQYRLRLEDDLRRLAERAWTVSVDELAARGLKPPVFLAYQGRDDLAIKTLFAELYTRSIPPWTPPRLDGMPSVGFIVSRGNEGIFLRGMSGVLSRLDTRRLRVVLVADMDARPAADAALSGAAVEFAPLPRDLLQAVDLVRWLKLDLAYHWEIGTDTTNYFLPLFRVAGLQCASWGWPVTSGQATVDYFLSSHRLEPNSGGCHYRERLVSIDRFPNYYARPKVVEIAATREMLGWSIHERVYLCAQNPRKLHPDFDPLAADILRRDSAATVVLLASSRASVTRKLSERFSVSMPDVAHRVRFAPRAGRAAFMGMLAAADVILDTPHYGGGANTTYDAFCVAAPLVTLPGNFHRGRYALAAYRGMGFSDLVAYSADQYAAIAVRLANEPDFREHARRQIAERRGVLFDDVQAVRQVEAFFLEAIAAARGGV